MVLLWRDRCILMLNQNHWCFSYFSAVLARRPCLTIPVHNGVCHTTGNISSGCLLFLPLFWPRETERKTEPRLNEPKGKLNRWEYRGIKQKCWETTSFHLCPSILTHQGSLPLAGRGKHEETMAEKHSMGFLLCLGVIHLPRLGSCVWPAEDRRAVFRQGISFYLLRRAKMQRCLLWTTPGLSRVMLPFSQPVPTSSAGIFPLPSITKVSVLQEMPILTSASFLFIRPYQGTWDPAPPVRSKAAETMAASCCVQLGSPPPVSALNALQLTLEETSQNPSYPRSNPWRAGLANGKQLQLLMLSGGIWALAVKVPSSGPVDRP